MPSQNSIYDRVDRAPVFRREGDYWTIVYDAAVVRLRDAKGLRYLEPLLRQPGQSFHVAELARLASRPDHSSGCAAPVWESAAKSWRGYPGVAGP